MKNHFGTVLLAALLCLSACKPTPTPTVAPTATPTFTPEPTSTPSRTPLPARYPTSTTPAPAQTFTEVGSTAHFTSENNAVAGRAIVAGTQTLIIRDFNFDGQCAAADIRLGKEGEFDQPDAILTTLESRTYKKELFVLIIPSDVTRDKTDAIAVFCADTGEVLGWGRFSY